MAKNNTTPKIEIGTTSEGSVKLIDVVAGIEHLLPKKLLKAFEMAVAISDDDAGYVYEDIFDYLNHICPDNVYWGASEGDGACFGFWKLEDYEA